ncbi:hypothetical protein SAMN02910456_00415 [Ruminococcaceae bacterium YRB3002]|nr:hypothetical protein SAMN02910456_00415 [Ruminococcaceae bacterium YRB3002]
MPHSSGGGSHGGGSHGGSHSHRGGSGSSRRVRNAPFPGARRYLYYQDHKPVFVYANYDVTKKKSPLRFLLLLFYVPFFVLGFIGIAFHTVEKPSRINADYDDKIVVSDTTGVLGDTDRMIRAMEDFRDETGITPSVMTVSNSYWQKNYTNLENYAYELYVNAFEDECHWLIVYSSGDKGEFDDWYWEGMQGDDTDPIITAAQADKFTKALQKEFLKKDTGRADAIAAAFEEVTLGIMKSRFNGSMLAASLFILIFCGIHAFLMLDIHPKRDKALQSAVLCDEDVVRQEQCDYCGGVYVVGHHLNCPHCQAPVKAHDYTVDEDGRVTGILN